MAEVGNVSFGFKNQPVIWSFRLYLYPSFSTCFIYFFNCITYYIYVSVFRT